MYSSHILSVNILLLTVSQLARIGALALLFSGADAREFVHPGGLDTSDDLSRMRENVAEGESPWIEGWKILLQDRKSQSDYHPLHHRHMGSLQRESSCVSSGRIRRNPPGLA